jgi:hypothetical protein
MSFTNIKRKDDIGNREAIKSITNNDKKIRSSPFMKGIDRTNIFATFYNVTDSTFLHGTDDIYQRVGNDSPVKYTKILDAVMFGLAEFTKEKDESEYSGFRIVRENTSLIPSGSFEPKVDSLFKLEIDNYTIMYRVKKVDFERIESNPFYIIEYEKEYIETDPEFFGVESQVINTYRFIYDHIGTEKKALILNEDFNTAEDIKKLRDLMNDMFICNFYDKGYNSIVTIKDNIIYYSPYLNKFIRHINMIRNLDSHQILILSDDHCTEDKLDWKWRQSFLVKLCNKQPVTANDYMFTRRVVDRSNYEMMFSPFRYETDLSLYVLERYDNALNNPLDFPEEMFVGIQDVETSSEPIDSFILSYINDVVDYSILKDNIDHISQQIDIDHMHKLPLIILILNIEYNKLIGYNILSYDTFFRNRLV